jgi:hypothetical protein
MLRNIEANEIFKGIKIKPTPRQSLPPLNYSHRYCEVPRPFNDSSFYLNYSLRVSDKNVYYKQHSDTHPFHYLISP